MPLEPKDLIQYLTPSTGAATEKKEPVYRGISEGLARDITVSNPGQDLLNLAEANQTFGERLARSAKQVGAEITLGTLEGLTLIPGVTHVIGALDGEQHAFGNALSERIGKLKEGITENNQIYGFDEFQPGKIGWWLKNAPSIATSLSLMIPAMAATKGLSLLGKASKVNKAVQAGKFGKALASERGNKAMQGLSSAIFSRYMENTMEASETYESILQDLTSKGVSREEAEQVAAQKASENWNQNWALLVPDAFQYMTMLKVFDHAGSATEGFFDKGVMKYLSTAATEAGEEGYQYVSSQEAQYRAREYFDLDQSKFNQRFAEYIQDDEFLTSITLGAAGGALFQALGGSVDKAFNGKMRKRLQAAADGIIATHYGDVATADAVSDEAFVEHAIGLAQAGKIDTLPDTLDELAKTELPDDTDESRASRLKRFEERKALVKDIKRAYNFGVENYGPRIGALYAGHIADSKTSAARAKEYGEQADREYHDLQKESELSSEKKTYQRIFSKLNSAQIAVGKLEEGGPKRKWYLDKIKELNKELELIEKNILDTDGITQEQLIKEVSISEADRKVLYRLHQNEFDATIKSIGHKKEAEAIENSQSKRDTLKQAFDAGAEFNAEKASSKKKSEAVSNSKNALKDIEKEDKKVDNLKKSQGKSKADIKKERAERKRKLVEDQRMTAPSINKESEDSIKESTTARYKNRPELFEHKAKSMNTSKDMQQIWGKRRIKNLEDMIEYRIAHAKHHKTLGSRAAEVFSTVEDSTKPNDIKEDITPDVNPSNVDAVQSEIIDVKEESKGENAFHNDAPDKVTFQYAVQYDKEAGEYRIEAVTIKGHKKYHNKTLPYNQAKKEFKLLPQEIAHTIHPGAYYVLKDLDGNPIDHAFNDFNYDAEFANSGAVTEGTTVYYEVDMGRKYSQDKHLQGLSKDPNQVAQSKQMFEILHVVYTNEKGEFVKPGEGRRRIIGRQKAFRNGQHNKADHFDFRNRIHAEWMQWMGETKGEERVFTSKETGTVGQMFHGRVYNISNNEQKPHVAVGQRPLVLGMVVKLGDKGTKTLTIPNGEDFGIVQGENVAEGSITAAEKGAVFMMVQAPSGWWIPYRVYTKRVSDFTDSEGNNPIRDQIIKILDKGFKDPDIREEVVTSLSKLVGWTGTLDLKKSPLENYEKLNLENAILQIDKDQVNNRKYNKQVSEKGYITTDLNQERAFHSVKFEILPTGVEATESIKTQSAEELTGEPPKQEPNQTPKEENVASPGVMSAEEMAEINAKEEAKGRKEPELPSALPPDPTVTQEVSIQVRGKKEVFIVTSEGKVTRKANGKEETRPAIKNLVLIKSGHIPVRTFNLVVNRGKKNQRVEKVAITLDGKRVFSLYKQTMGNEIPMNRQAAKDAVAVYNEKIAKEVTTPKPVPVEDTKVQVNQYTFVVKVDGTVFDSKGEKITDQRTINKAHLMSGHIQHTRVSIPTKTKKKGEEVEVTLDYAVTNEGRIISLNKSSVGRDIKPGSSIGKKVMDKYNTPVEEEVTPSEETTEETSTTENTTVERLNKISPLFSGLSKERQKEVEEFVNTYPSEDSALRSLIERLHKEEEEPSSADPFGDVKGKRRRRKRTTVGKGSKGIPTSETNKKCDG